MLKTIKPLPSREGQRFQQQKHYSQNTPFYPAVQGENVEKFKEEMRQAGLKPSSCITPGKFERFPGVDKEHGDKAGWCFLFEDELGGIYGDWSSGVKGSWQSHSSSLMTRDERLVYKNRIKLAQRKAKAERDKQQDGAMRRALPIWDSAKKVSPNHGYLSSKGVTSHSLRIYKGCLVVPLRIADKLYSLQFIEQGGSKRFLSGGRIKGCYHLIGVPRGVVCICEGYATGATIHEVTGHPVAIAFNAGNLEAVAVRFKSQLPDVSIIICADDDWKSTGNPGLVKAKAAAKNVDGCVATPHFGEDRPAKATDFNDMASFEGKDAVQVVFTELKAGIEAAKWPKLLPLSAGSSASPYPVDALPITIREVVQEVVGFVQCPVALAVCSALSVISTVVQGLVDVRRAVKLEGPTSLFTLTIADSGERKSTVDGFFSKPLLQWELEQKVALEPEMEKFKAEKQAWEAKRSGLLSAIKAGVKKGRSVVKLEGEIANHEREKPQPPQVPRLLFSDSTPEALAYRLVHNWPAGGVLSSEAGVVLGGHAMNADSAMRNMAMLNSLWSAESITIDRRSTPSYKLHGVRLTIGLACQPTIIRNFLDSSKGLARGIGFLARFLVAWPESTQGFRMYKKGPVNWLNLDKFHQRLRVLLERPLPYNDEGVLEPPVLKLSPHAKSIWVAFHDDVEIELRPGREMAEVRDVASKAADNAVRVAALFHVFENRPGDEIEPDYMKAAISIVGWHLYEARRFMGEIILPDKDNHVVYLNNWLLGYCEKMDVNAVPLTEILQKGPAATRNMTARDQALDKLVSLGRVVEKQVGQRRFVEINPALLRRNNGTT